MSHTDASDGSITSSLLLALGLCSGLEKGDIAAEDVDLAAKIATGKLSSNRTMSSLFHAVVEMQEKVDRGLIRVRRAADQDVLNEVFSVFHVWSEQPVQAPSGPVRFDSIRVSDFGDRLPPQVLRRPRQQADAGQEREVQFGATPTSHEDRSFFVALDETYRRSCYDSISGYTSDGKRLIVGGQFSDDKVENWSWLVPADELPPAKLSRVCLHYVLGRSHTAQQIYEVSMIPLPPGSTGKAEDFLRWTGQLLAIICRANGGLAPLGVSTDAGGANSSLRAAFLGLLTEKVMAKHPLFQECSTEGMQLREFHSVAFCIARSRCSSAWTPSTY